MLERLERFCRKRFENRLNRECQIKKQHHGKRKLVAAQLSDFLWDAILIELEIILAQRTNWPMRLVVQYLRINLDQIDTYTNYLMAGGAWLVVAQLCGQERLEAGQSKKRAYNI